ncbi:DNA cytosine methyltransferase [Undibacterium curvum]|uniref:DNA (cytosine-5-)-methyltransferase n=1 Tax=Undibacterium curvum TaxID=2762294 RepID=A0ABR7A6T8_9BURK|nr:DNA cytosine methyltransferase [Undibacterium curvum]MBC3932614.1 DNA cytosine methyltransferase [Undibacterium curvum]
MQIEQIEAFDLDVLNPFGFYEFFAGGGMARLGLGAAWQCLFANDFDEKKVASYRQNFSSDNEMHHEDVAKIALHQMPDVPTLAWASFPCQDLSLAGNGKGLAGDRSGVFWAFWKLMQGLGQEGRRPPIIALENVSGLITSHGGKDLTNLITALSTDGYRIGAMLVDGALFVAQSRPRLFLIAVARGVSIPKGLTAKVPNPCWHPTSLQNVVEALPSEIKKSWLWWQLPLPTNEAPHLSEIIESEPIGVEWHSGAETKKLLSMMTPANLNKVEEAKKSGQFQVGTIYKRTRDGIQRAEIRFDGVSGCLRTPSGGSSRQIVMIVDGNTVRSRLISPRETARLMGLPETYILPNRYNDAYHLTGDGVVVPAVSWIEQHILRPVGLSAQKSLKKRTRGQLALETA